MNLFQNNSLQLNSLDQENLLTNVRTKLILVWTSLLIDLHLLFIDQLLMYTFTCEQLKEIFSITSYRTNIYVTVKILHKCISDIFVKMFEKIVVGVFVFLKQKSLTCNFSWLLWEHSLNFEFRYTVTKMTIKSLVYNLQ